MNNAISLTELRQRLFQLADHVADTGEPLVIMRNGVRLHLTREDAIRKMPGRLARLVKRSIVIGPPLDPHESPAEWSGDVSKVAETASTYTAPKRLRRRAGK